MGCLSLFCAPDPDREDEATLCDRDNNKLDMFLNAQVDTTERLAKLRALLKEEGIDYYLIPSGDAHNSEWVGNSDLRRQFISGFSGSAGTAIVSATDARLFTDSRYYIQAEKQLDSNWKLEKVGLKDVPTWDKFLVSLPKSTVIGVDPSLLSSMWVKSLVSKGVTLSFPTRNFIDAIWVDQPQRTANSVSIHPFKFTGKETSAKIAELRKQLATQYDNNTGFLLTALNNIAWLLNLRGSDIEFNPFFFSYLLVSQTRLIFWIQSAAVSPEIKCYIKELGGEIKEYANALDDWKDLGDEKVVINNNTSWAAVLAIREENILYSTKPDPVEVSEAIKNPIELEGLRKAYLRDGATWVKWSAWLEEQICTGIQVSEWDAAEELTRLRKLNENYVGLAYGNISATAGNAALPHYEPTAESNCIIDSTTPYLNDSGPQYLDGTIDTTRTVHFGKPTKDQKRAFTRVLQGHIAIDSLTFPEGTTGGHIDVLARAPLWKDGLNYGHGTGHGIGSYLAVHEGPQGISSANSTVLQIGHVQSNEPAYYQPNKFGIRIESVLAVQSAKTRYDTGDRPWFSFERLTVVPIQQSFVEWKLLDPHEKTWLREHNKTVCAKLLPLLGDDKRAKKWLKRQ